MNHNSYPATHTPENQPSSAELEYRQKLTDEVLSESIGTVGIYTTTDLTEQQATALNQKISERNPQGAGSQVTAGRNGWGDWGERTIGAPLNPATPNHNLLAVSFNQDQHEEQAAFIALPDGTVEVRYRFTTDKGYQDGMGRPGNILTVGFNLSPEKAAELDSAIEADPTFMAKVVESQVLSTGMPKEIWDRQLRPRKGFTSLAEAKDHALAITHATADGRQTTALRAYTDKQPILPEMESPTEVQTRIETEPSYSYDEYYETFMTLDTQTIKNAKDRGTPITELIKILQAENDEAFDELVKTETGSPEHSYYLALQSAHGDTIYLLENELAQHAAHAEQQQNVVQAQSEVTQALAANPESSPSTTSEYAVGSSIQYKDSVRIVDSTYKLGNGKQMLVLKDNLGREEHVMADKINRQ